MRSGGIEHRLAAGAARRVGAFAEPGRYDHRGFRAALGQLPYELGHGVRWGAQHGEVRAHRQAIDVRISEYALNSSILGIDWHDRPLEPGLEQVARENRANGAGRPASTDEGHRLGSKQMV